jgi:transcriptional regulator with XRE-family HTH domain
MMKTGPAPALPSQAPGDIAGRLTSARRFARLSQTALALRTGLSRDQIAAIECRRVPLRFWPGWKICRELNISQIWLIIGAGTMSPFLDLDLESAEVALGERDLFRDICFHVLRPRLNARAQEVLAFRGSFRHSLPVAPPLDDAAINSKQNRILRLEDQARSMWREAARLRREVEAAQKGENRVLTKHSESVILPLVKSELDGLLAEARRLTKSRGMKAKLARAVQAKMPRVSDWLAGRCLPSGDRALRLRDWVSAQRVEQKRDRRSASTPRGPETQSRKTKNEK